MIKPSSSSTIVGDTLVVSERTDIDSIIVSWGESIQTDDLKSGISTSKKISTFSAFYVVSTPDNPNYEYTMKLAQVTVPTSHATNIDTLIPEKKTNTS